MLAGLGLLPLGLSADSGAVPAADALPGTLEDAVDPLLAQETHGHGPPSSFSRTERSFSAGPSFMLSRFIR